MKKEYKAEFDHSTRRIHYIQANEEMPSVRKLEIYLMMQKIGAARGETIADYGSGKGALTFMLAKKVGKNGYLIALDNSKKTLDIIKEKKKPNIETKLLKDETIPLRDNSVDKLVSLASFHHVLNKEKAFKEFYRVIKKGGKLIIGDVADQTNVQRYFDGPVNSFCSTGHKHIFLDENRAKELCRYAGFSEMKFSIEQTPWVFCNEKEAGRFLHLIHDATCTPEECLMMAKEYLGFSQKKDKFSLNWQLFYLVAEK